jgi:hypothetical protein
MPRKPEPPKPTSWDIYKVAKKAGAGETHVRRGQRAFRSKQRVPEELNSPIRRFVRLFAFVRFREKLPSSFRR